MFDISIYMHDRHNVYRHHHPQPISFQQQFGKDSVL
uniref:Uncharacterized protein n=1 Tax=Anguilla anguilla TaxID=7936 RepID=A0A0E9S9Y4_ANGAN